MKLNEGVDIETQVKTKCGKGLQKNKHKSVGTDISLGIDKIK